MNESKKKEKCCPAFLVGIRFPKFLVEALTAIKTIINYKVI